WNPALYTRFEDERTRPAAELLARVPLESPRLAIDLGCGPGNSTALIAARFPDAEVIGLDTSPAMLESARARLPRLAFAL
ncbi:methyltransferase domain-containing protein, partial [Roseovarius mucosus]|uniref:methyltransferase domain-containing protein n=1 Tax=Roseovarius mucosus TaxID=215743 RepID=UPI001C5CFC3E